MCPCSGGENNLVAEHNRNGPTGFMQGLQVSLGSFLKPQQRLPAVVAVGMANLTQPRW